MQNNILSLARDAIIKMAAYRSARSEMQTGNIWLDANENPNADTIYNRYPEPQPAQLLSLLAKMYKVQEEELLMTRGSDEGIDLLTRLFCEANRDNILICPPTYGMYQISATIQGAGITKVPLLKEKNFALDVPGILKASQPNIKLVFLCSPNNPTGNLLATEDILALCKALAGKAVIVVDEAYIEFANAESLSQYIQQYDNLVVLRTLSKAYGMAGLRLGVTIANPALINLLKKIIAPYPIAQPVAELVYERLNSMQQDLDAILTEREKLITFLKSLSYVTQVWQSEANFILFAANNAKDIFKQCLNEGIVLRDRSREYGLENCIRVSVGTPLENKSVMEVLNNA